MAAKFEISQDHAGTFRFHHKAPNGEIVAASQGFESTANAEKGIEVINTHARDAKSKTTTNPASALPIHLLAAVGSDSARVAARPAAAGQAAYVQSSIGGAIGAWAPNLKRFTARVHFARRDAESNEGGAAALSPNSFTLRSSSFCAPTTNGAGVARGPRQRRSLKAECPQTPGQ